MVSSGVIGFPEFRQSAHATAICAVRGGEHGPFALATGENTKPGASAMAAAAEKASAVVFTIPLLGLVTCAERCDWAEVLSAPLAQPGGGGGLAEFSEGPWQMLPAARILRPRHLLEDVYSGVSAHRAVALQAGVHADAVDESAVLDTGTSPIGGPFPTPIWSDMLPPRQLLTSGIVIVPDGGIEARSARSRRSSGSASAGRSGGRADDD
jgi:hypothetical protein